MYFNSLEFLAFFIAVLLLYWGMLQKHLKARNLFIWVVSYVFYAFWDWRFLSLIALSSFIDFLAGIQVAKNQGAVRKRWLLLSICTNLGILFTFKYYGFFVDSAHELLLGLGFVTEQIRLDLILPVGISFYTFQTLSYTIDVYRNKIEAEKDVVSFFAFVSFFPQLVAGPIERAGDLLPQFRKKPKLSAEEAADALRQILWGLFKKVVVADQIVHMVNHTFTDYASLSASTLWLGAFYFSVQIYCDFSGYSDMAIGTARLLGFRLSTNFRFPYFATSFRAFWRRWHISLSTWFRDYVYIPLGGSRSNKGRVAFNLMLTFVLSGLWHGASWNFVFWGLLNGLYLLPGIWTTGHQRDKDSSVNSYSLVPKAMLVFAVTLLTWVFFKSATLPDAFSYLERMFSTEWGAVKWVKLYPLLWIGFLFLVEIRMSKMQNPFAIVQHWPMAFRWGLYLFLLLAISYFFKAYQTFLYFQF